MKLVKVAAAALNQTPLDWTGNKDNILEAIRQAQEQNVNILCLPEMCISGYGCEDRFLSPDVAERSFKALHEIAKHTEGIVVCVGLPLYWRGALYNVIAVVQNRDILGFVAKQHLAGDGLHYENRWFKPWPVGHKDVVENMIKVPSYPGGDRFPIGDLQFNFFGIRVGFEICEDAFVADRPGARLARKGVDIILNPSASHFAFGKRELRKRLVTEGSRAFSASYVYANLLGNEAGRAIYDGECLIASGGIMISSGTRFSYKNVALTAAIVDVEFTRTQQASTASFTPDHSPTHWIEGYSVECRFGVVPTLPTPSFQRDVFEEFMDAVPLALFDYMRKSHTKGFVISLSGGADSAAVAMLVKLMVRNGLKELGLDEFLRKTGLPDMPEAFIMRKILTCVYQATSNSSTTTLDAARVVANGIGSKFVDIDIDPIVKAYESVIAVALQYELDWAKDDITRQNTQARARAPSAWMIANIEGKLLLTTSNRSESAVGYCTMDGDTAGGLGPIGGIDKDFLLRWLTYRPLYDDFPFLECIIKQKPTAELRPGNSQTDEADLMPYNILEMIENLAILERKGPMDVFNSIRGYSSGFGPENLKRLYYDVEKFFKLWCRNQWKRERYALSFHVDDRNLDPRSWCRFPVLSGGFEVELDELKKTFGIS